MLSIKEDNDAVRDFLYALLFGLLSIFFGSFKLFIPGFEGVSSDFREIPLLISVLYLRRPYLIVLMSVLTTLSVTSKIYYPSMFLMHTVGLAFVWYYNKAILEKLYTYTSKISAWVAMVVLYYLVFLIPILLIVYQIIRPSVEFIFTERYAEMFNSSMFEMLATGIITSLFYMQYEAKNRLTKHKEELEEIVKERTNELAISNEKLTASNKEIKAHNENLDELVQLRSQKIKEQLKSFHEYANINSHEVRAPLSNILGLLQVLENEKDDNQRAELLERLNKSAIELDDIIRKMNELLEKETFS